LEDISSLGQAAIGNTRRSATGIDHTVLIDIRPAGYCYHKKTTTAENMDSKDTW